MVNTKKMDKEARAELRKLSKEEKKSVREAGECNPDDIYERCQRISLSDPEDVLGKKEINFPCSREDESNLIPGLDDCTCIEKSKILFYSSKNRLKSGYIGSYTGSVVVVKERRRY